MMVHETSCPKNNNQHCKKEKKLEAHALTTTINIVEESKK